MADRGVSAVLGYVLVLGIVTLLISGLFLAAGNFVENQHQRAVRAEFEVVGNRVAADIAAIDRLALASGPDGRAELEVNLPPLAAGKTYEITTSSAGGNVSFVNVSTTDASFDVAVEVRVKTDTTLAATTVSGGDVVIVYDGSQIEVREDA
ncbi:MAG: hypothetical protein ABEJ92_06225 [Halobacteriales archaeon]